MCAYYEDEQILRKGDKAIFKNQNITIIASKHIKENRTMDITYTLDSNINHEELKMNIPYKTTGYELELTSRKVS